MNVFEGFARFLAFAIVAGWTCDAAFPREPDPGQRAAAGYGPSLALSETDQPASRPPNAANPGLSMSPLASICVIVEQAAQTHGLPLDFFARLIWQESRFNPALIGPTTRNGQRAKGIAQFMPDTAKERGVQDPFDPGAALPKSAEFLRELRLQFSGNLGLAAAAYNAGPKRVRSWLSGRSRLPGQTRDYVSAITGRSADEWAASFRRHGDDSQNTALNKHGSSCNELLALLKAEPVLFADEFDRRLGDDELLQRELSAGFGQNRALPLSL